MWRLKTYLRLIRQFCSQLLQSLSSWILLIKYFLFEFCSDFSITTWKFFAFQKKLEVNFCNILYELECIRTWKWNFVWKYGSKINNLYIPYIRRKNVAWCVIKIGCSHTWNSLNFTANCALCYVKTNQIRKLHACL